MSDISLTPEILADISKLPPRQRAGVISALAKAEFDRCADDPLYWLDASQHHYPYVYTTDPHPMYACKLCGDGEVVAQNKRKDHLAIRHEVAAEKDRDLRMFYTPLPATRVFTLHDYMKPIVEFWQVEQIVLWRKSRDMMATWLSVALHTWDALFHAGRQHIFQSEDAPKTLELVRRAHYIYEHQPQFLKGLQRASFTIGGSRSGIFTVAGLESEILGFPQGPNQIRQLHPSGVFQDEAAFQVEAAEAFAAIKPSILSGGKFTAVSTAYPSWFCQACRDNVEGF